MEENLSKFLVEGCHTKESFVRDSLIEIYSSIDAPVTIDSIELSDVHESTYQILGQTADYEITYSSEIGYDRQEQYLDEERVYDKDLQRTITRNVVKTRTVTDWQPYNGTVTKKGAFLNELTNNDTVDLGDLDETVACQFAGFCYEESEVCFNGTPVSDPEKLSAIDFVEPTSNDIDYAVECGAIKPKVEFESEMPGDHHRNLKITWKANNVVPTVFAVNRFKAAFDFDGKTHYARQFTTERLPGIFCSYRKNDDVLADLKKNCEEEIKNDPIYKKNEDMGMYCGLGLFGGIAVVFLCMIISAIPPILALFGGVIAIVSGILMSRFNKKRDAQKKLIQEKFEQLQKDHKKELQKQKAELLNARFAMMGLDPLTDLEMERFKLKNTHYLSTNYSEDGFGELVEDEEELEDEDDE